MLRTRVVVGAILAVGAVLVIVLGKWVYFTVMVLLALLALNEFFRMTRSYRPLALAGYIGLGFMLYCAWYRTLSGVLASIGLLVLVTFLLGALGGVRPGITGRMAVTVLGGVYLGLGFGHLLLMRRLEAPAGSSDAGMALVLTVVFGTWAGDTLAYFVGRYFGSTPMAPRLSPKKTWEGFLGGILGTVLAVVLVGVYTDLKPSESLILGLVIAIVGPLGDLFESLVKRDVNVKDAGAFLPGHGGVLDRFDALLFSAVAVFYAATGLLGY
jgi:phosphatidate cytidylyltransferase